MDTEESCRQWTKILGYQVGQKVRILIDTDIFGEFGKIIKMGFDTSGTIFLYWVECNHRLLNFKGEIQLIKGEFESVVEDA